MKTAHRPYWIAQFGWAWEMFLLSPLFQLIVAHSRFAHKISLNILIPFDHLPFVTIADYPIQAGDGPHCLGNLSIEPSSEPADWEHEIRLPRQKDEAGRSKPHPGSNCQVPDRSLFELDECVLKYNNAILRILWNTCFHSIRLHRLCPWNLQSVT